MTYLTERQRDVLDYIWRSVERTGVAPTLQEIADHFGFASTASAQKHVGLLEKKGFLRREKHQKRGLVLSSPARRDAAAGHRLPLLGVVAAGSPIESVPEAESVAIPSELLRSGEHYVLRVRGDSMIEEGIHDGDFVIVQSVSRANEGEVVVALVDDEVTLKRLFRLPRGRVRLQPANSTMAPLDYPAAQVRIQGVVVGLVRRY